MGCWKDKSGNGNDFTESDGSLKPIRKNSVKNGKNGVRFDGTNDRLVGGDILDLGTSNLYVFAVTKINSTNVYGCIISKSLEVNTTTRWLLARYPFQPYGVDILAYSHPTTGNHVFVAKNDVINVTDYRCFTYFIEKSGNPYVTLKINSILYGTANGPNDTLSWNSTMPCIVGNTCDASGTASNAAPLNGDICEIILYIRSTMTASEIEANEKYLMAKWGLP